MFERTCHITWPSSLFFHIVNIFSCISVHQSCFFTVSLIFFPLSLLVKASRCCLNYTSSFTEVYTALPTFSFQNEAYDNSLNSGQKARALGCTAKATPQGVFKSFSFSRMTLDAMSINFTTDMLISLIVYQRCLKHLWIFKACKNLGYSNP